MEETKRGRGRPYADNPREMIRFRLPATKKADLTVAAERLGITVTDALEQAVDAWLGDYIGKN